MEIGSITVAISIGRDVPHFIIIYYYYYYYFFLLRLV
jgi:hypothetical protein